MTEKLKRYKIRREAVFFLILVSSLCSCSGIGTEKKPFTRHGRKGKNKSCPGRLLKKHKVDRGTLKNSEYWIQFYQKSIELRPDLDDFLYFANEMIKVSRIFEEGKITKEQFEDKRRQLTALLAQEETDAPLR